MLIVKTELKETRNKGIGLFAVEKIERGSIIHMDETEIDKIYNGDLVRKSVCKEFFDKYASYNFSEDTYYLCVDNARFINHSDSPNTRYDKLTGNTVAICDIEAGKEILADYCEFCDASKYEGMGFEIEN